MKLPRVVRRRSADLDEVLPPELRRPKPGTRVKRLRRTRTGADTGLEVLSARS
jgi:hypothetical protein